MNKTNEIETKLFNIIQLYAEQISFLPIVERESNLKEDLELDSLDILELSSILEKEFQIEEFKEKDIHGWVYVRDIEATLVLIISQKEN